MATKMASNNHRGCDHCKPQEPHRHHRAPNLKEDEAEDLQHTIHESCYEYCSYGPVPTLEAGPSCSNELQL